MRVCIRTVLLSGFLLLGAMGALAQTSKPPLRYTVRGTVSDAYTGKSLPAVNISVSERYYASVSNSDGGFVIKSDTPVRELVFSCVGYKTLILPVMGENVSAKMVPEKYTLDASVLVTGDPWEIVNSAIMKIPENYSGSPELLRCFYRETLQKKNRYISVSEAVARIFKSSYAWSSGADRTALEKSRIIVSQRKRDTLSVKMMGGPTLAATADIVKNRDIVFEDMKDGLYAFEMGMPEYIDDRLQFVIHFSPNADAEYALFYGTFYIDRDRLSFTRIEMTMDMKDQAKVTRQLLVRKPRGLRFTPKEMSFLMTYRLDGSISRLEYFRSTIRFNCDWKKRLLATSYAVVNETVITDVVAPPVPISRQEMFRTTDFMTDKATEFLDPEFWKDYNIIEPTESLEHAVGRLHKTY